MASFVGKAVVLTASGGPEVLKAITDHGVRAPAAGEVLVKLVATSVNPVDVYVRSGSYARCAGGGSLEARTSSSRAPKNTRLPRN